MPAFAAELISFKSLNFCLYDLVFHCIIFFGAKIIYFTYELNNFCFLVPCAISEVLVAGLCRVLLLITLICPYFGCSAATFPTVIPIPVF